MILYFSFREYIFTQERKKEEEKRLYYEDSFVAFS